MKKGERTKKDSPPSALLQELEMGLEPPLQLWGKHSLYLERCSEVTAFGEGYIRFKAGGASVTVFGDRIQVEEFRGGRLLVTGKFSSVEFE